jgi:amino acid adenylation domain-containing protein
MSNSTDRGPSRTHPGRRAVATGAAQADVIRQFEWHVQRTPNAVAVEYCGDCWSYAELDQRAERIAGRLRRLDVGRDALVGVYCERSREMIAAILGVMKAGGAYLPLDPSYPTQRLALMLDDVRPPAVLIQADLRDRLPHDYRGKALCVDSDAEDNAEGGPDGPPTLPRRPLRFEDLAYAIFTSGSTGRPKAALICHRGLAHLVQAQREALSITPRSRVLQFSSLSFDASVWEIFVTLASGATLCLADPWRLSPGEELARTLSELQITTVTLPPSILGLLGNADLPQLETLVVAGERCSGELASRWSVGRRLINAYGPTETTVCATLYCCPEGPQSAPPIGRPLPHCELLILDAHKRPVADGQVGELYIGGPGVARGYLNRPELTAARFVPHPLTRDGAQRFYQSGDRVRRRADGNIEFLGRVDYQVKIRGVRIELDEIAGVLEQHPQVSEAVVVHDTQAEGGSRLAAFAVGGNADPPASRELCRILRESLPTAMIPNAVVVLDQMPLTRNGKIDRRALLSLIPVADACDPQSLAPRDHLELELAQIWQQLLNRQTVGVTDDFFDLGGDSLLAMELLARLERQCGCRLSPAALLAGPTIETLAAAMRHRRDPADWSPIVPIQPAGTKRPFFCIHPGGGNALCYLNLAKHLGQDQPLFALQAPGIDGVRSPLETVEQMAAEYVAAIRQVQPTGPYLIGGWSFGGIVAYEMACQLEQQSQQVAALVLLDTGMVYSFAVMRTLFPEDNVPLTRMAGIDPVKQLDYFRRYSAGAQLIPPGAGDRLAKRILNIFQANAEAIYSYRPRPYRGKADLLLASDQFVRVRVRRDPYGEWRELCHGGVERHSVPGNHLSMLFDPHAEAVAHRVRACLEQADTTERRHPGKTTAQRRA